MDALNNILHKIDEGYCVLLGCTGSVGTIKVPQIARKLKQNGANVIIIPSKKALPFLLAGDERHSIDTTNGGKSQLCAKCDAGIEIELVKSKYPDLCFIDDSFEWGSWKKRGDLVIHIELRKWADALLIAPLSANTLAKIATGHCDNLLTSLIRAWDVAKPLIFCPAMNTHMYQHPVTSQHIQTLKSWGYCELPVISKILMCGDVGIGAMAETGTIIGKMKELMAGK